MAAPRTREPLLLYLAATPQTASAVLVVEREGPVIAKRKNASPSPEPLAEVDQQENLAEAPLQQENLAKQLREEYLDKHPASSPTAANLIQHPVYLFSTVLRDTRERYPMQQKLLYTLLIASRKLRHYFEAHPIRVVTSYPLEQVLRNPNATGRVAEWNIELQHFELTFHTTSTIKSRALAEFTAEWTDPSTGDDDEQESTLPGEATPGCWAMSFDGAFASTKGAGATAVLISPIGDKLRYAV